MHFEVFQELLLKEGVNGGKPIDDEFFRTKIAGRQNAIICADLFPQVALAPRITARPAAPSLPRVSASNRGYLLRQGTDLGPCLHANVRNQPAPTTIDACMSTQWDTATAEQWSYDKEAAFRDKAAGKLSPITGLEEVVSVRGLAFFLLIPEATSGQC